MNAIVTCPLSVFSLHHFPKSIMHLSWRAGSSFTSKARWCRIRWTSVLHSRDNYRRQIWTFVMNKPTQPNIFGGFFFHKQIPILQLGQTQCQAKTLSPLSLTFFAVPFQFLLSLIFEWLKGYLIRKYLNKSQEGSNWTNWVKLQFLL